VGKEEDLRNVPRGRIRRSSIICAAPEGSQYVSKSVGKRASYKPEERKGEFRHRKKKAQRRGARFKYPRRK